MTYIRLAAPVSYPAASLAHLLLVSKNNVEAFAPDVLESQKTARDLVWHACYEGIFFGSFLTGLLMCRSIVN